jgi:hypothetical protein
MLVIVVMALATIMAYAMLSGSIMQQQVAANETSGAQSDTLAESGVALAMYYLQNPIYAPSYVPSSGTTPPYWSGTTSASFTGMNGTAAITVAPAASPNVDQTLWTITSTGTGSAAAGGSFSKATSATAQVNAIFQANQALTTNSAVTLGANMAFHGNGYPAVVSNGKVTTGSATFGGVIDAPSISYSGARPATGLAPIVNPLPVMANVRDYTQKYTYGGSSLNQPNLLSTLLGWLLSILGLNPLGILYYNSSVTLSGGNYSGMLDVTSGSLTISGNVTITAPAGYPALVVANQILMSHNATLTVNGMVYAGTGIGTAGGNSTGSAITINGGLMMPAPGNIPSQYSGSLTVNFTPANASIPNFTTYAPCLTPQSVKLVSWSP